MVGEGHFTERVSIEPGILLGERMPIKGTESQIIRLRQEIEKLSTEHAEKMKQHSGAANPKLRAAEAKRAEMLAGRIRHLNEMLDALQHEMSK